MIKAPCKGCTDRCAGCHSFCGNWAQYEKQKKQIYEKKRLQSLGRPDPSAKSLHLMKEAMKK